MASSGEAPTFYEVLGVSRDAGSEEIRRAYVAHARRLHPDTGSAAADAAAMQALNEAWRVLRDPGRRAAYDRSLGIDPTPGPTFEPITLQDFADLVADDAEPPTPRAGDLVMLLPAGFLVGAIGLLAFGAMSVNASVIGLAFGLLVVSGVSFLLAPFFTMARNRRHR